jgi:hypothetical protein
VKIPLLIYDFHVGWVLPETMTTLRISVEFFCFILICGYASMTWTLPFNHTINIFCLKHSFWAELVRRLVKVPLLIYKLHVGWILPETMTTLRISVVLSITRRAEFLNLFFIVFIIIQVVTRTLVLYHSICIVCN